MKTPCIWVVWLQEHVQRKTSILKKNSRVQNLIIILHLIVNIYDQLMSTRIFVLIKNEIFYLNFKNYEESGSKSDLDFYPSCTNRVFLISEESGLVGKNNHSRLLYLILQNAFPCKHTRSWCTTIDPRTPTRHKARITNMSLACSI